MTRHVSPRRTTDEKASPRGRLGGEGAGPASGPDAWAPWQQAADAEGPQRAQLWDHELRETGNARLGLVDDDSP